MPYVQIRTARNLKAPLTVEQKNELISGVTQLLGQVLGLNAAYIMVEISEGDPDNWGLGGISVSSRLQAGAAGGK